MSRRHRTIKRRGEYAANPQTNAHVSPWLGRPNLGQDNGMNEIQCTHGSPCRDRWRTAWLVGWLDGWMHANKDPLHRYFKQLWLHGVLQREHGTADIWGALTHHWEWRKCSDGSVDGQTVRWLLWMRNHFDRLWVCENDYSWCYSIIADCWLMCCGCC